jgi:hypothetical protein
MVRALPRVLVAAGLSFVFLACASSSGDSAEGDGADTTGDALSASNGNVSLLYEGTCEFLHECSSFSRKLPANGVQWGCGFPPSCDNSDLWVAGPTHGNCSKFARFCNGSLCANALVKDVSVSGNWEASNGLLDALHLPHALVGKCGGSGGGKVKVTFPAPPSTIVAAKPKDVANDAGPAEAEATNEPQP